MSASPLAAALWRARGAGATIAADAGGKPATIEAAYALQAEVAALAGPRAGWKLGATSERAQTMLGLDGPFYAPLFASFVHDSGASIEVSPAHAAGVEGEFAVVLGHDLPPRAVPYGRDEVAAAVAAVAPAVEVAGSRVPGWPGEAAALMLIADDGANVAFVAGAKVADWRGFDLAAHEVRMTFDGEERAQGTGAAVMGHPLVALTWLANQLSSTGRTLREGDVVTTGTCTGFQPVTPGVSVAADFGPLGRVEVRLTG